jgi:hypothetical protein
MPNSNNAQRAAHYTTSHMFLSGKGDVGMSEHARYLALYAANPSLCCAVLVATGIGRICVSATSLQTQQLAL